jgi:hypothetical protein
VRFRAHHGWDAANLAGDAAAYRVLARRALRAASTAQHFLAGAWFFARGTRSVRASCTDKTAEKLAGVKMASHVMAPVFIRG